ncbi:hypothetical protein PROFUN_12805 [Planoprotostelium fungivorum]|uniref:Uncharacterized protein n=1 Tax=Planoprotostelium fungivorum TaxID=1890364 RepID=A0A2P6N6N0_9EUKA|nr:hypothetical protein PROFUN_12805 [Planoprotostelium fungivorum]
MADQIINVAPEQVCSRYLQGNGKCLVFSQEAPTTITLHDAGVPARVRVYLIPSERYQQELTTPSVRSLLRNLPARFKLMDCVGTKREYFLKKERKCKMPEYGVVRDWSFHYHLLMIVARQDQPPSFSISNQFKLVPKTSSLSSPHREARRSTYKDRPFNPSTSSGLIDVTQMLERPPTYGQPSMFDHVTEEQYPELAEEMFEDQPSLHEDPTRGSSVEKEHREEEDGQAQAQPILLEDSPDHLVVDDNGGHEDDDGQAQLAEFPFNNLPPLELELLSISFDSSEWLDLLQ